MSYEGDRGQTCKKSQNKVIVSGYTMVVGLSIAITINCIMRRFTINYKLLCDVIVMPSHSTMTLSFLHLKFCI